MSYSVEGLNPIGKIRLALRTWFLLFDLQVRLRRYPSPRSWIS